jgi:alcohol dehydrogenase (cytochrome c)
MKWTLFVITLFCVCANAQVRYEDILKGASRNWLTYAGTYQGSRYSPLTQITPENAGSLVSKWVYHVPNANGLRTSPIVYNGVMYVTNSNSVYALDARSGRLVWQYVDTRSKKGGVNRGAAILGNSVYFTTTDNYLTALDRQTGALLFSKQFADAEKGITSTSAPLIVKDKVIVGVAGGEFGIRGFIAAYDVKTGKEAWRFNTIPGPGEAGHETWKGDSWKTGGASVWVTGSYDPDLNLTYWGIGNAGPDYDGDVRVGDNLYSSSVVALDADTGKLKWHYQFSPHDQFDYDSVQVPVLADITWQGSLRKVMLWANRNGFFYVLDRATGKFLLGKPFVEVNWASGFDETGRPMRVPGKVPSPEGTVIFPGNQGGTNWYSPSFSPRTGLFYIPSWVNYSSIYLSGKQEYTEGNRYLGVSPRSVIGGMFAARVNTRKEDEGYGAIRAIDPMTGDRKWEFKMNDVTDAGVMSTGSDLVFSGGREGYFYALNARNGELLWKTSVGGGVASGPMSYSIGGKQYIAIPAGNSLFVYGLRE